MAGSSTIAAGSFERTRSAFRGGRGFTPRQIYRLSLRRRGIKPLPHEHGPSLLVPHTLALHATGFCFAVIFMLDRTNIAMLVEAAFALIGVAVLWFGVLQPSARTQLEIRLPTWTILLADFLTFLLFTVGMFLIASFAGGLLSRTLHLAEDEKLIFLSTASQLGMLAGPLLYAAIYHDQLALVLGPPKTAIISGIATFFISLPFVFGIGIVWVGLLKLCRFPIEKQTAIELFQRTKHSGWLATLVITAVVIAPMAEELIFRAGIFRYARTRLPRWLAFLLPALLFAAMHQSLATFGQLTMLAIVFSIAYERTGRIGTCMVAHALFNLNMVVLLLIGVDF